MRKKIKEYLILIIIWIFFFFLLFTQELKCVWHEVTGFYCPGCGITRMALSLMSGEIYQAFRYNPLLFLLIVCGIIYVVYSLIRYRKIKKIDNKIVIMIVVITILYGILRNIPNFDFLAPTAV